jgi:hypothetical protein
MKQILLDRPQSVLGSKNIVKILLVPDLPINFNPSRASLNLLKCIEFSIEFPKL